MADLGDEVVDHAGDDRRCASLQGHNASVCLQASVRAIVATGDVKTILLSDNEPAILDLKRQAAAEFRVRHGMTVIIDDTIEYESQDNGLAQMPVCEVKGVARSVRVALGELYQEDIGSKHPVLPWLVAYAGGQITRGQIGDDGLTPHQSLKGRAFRKLQPAFAESVLYLPIGKRACRLPERWSDGLFLVVVERSSEFCMGTVLGVVRARSLRSRPVDERAHVELLDKLVGVPWQPVPGDPDSSAVPTVISEEPIAEGDDLPDHADSIPGAPRRTYLRKNVELKRHGYTGGCPGCGAARLNTAATSHTAACRARVEEAMTGDEAGRARLAETLLRRDTRREPEDPETVALGVRRRLEGSASSSGGHRAAAPTFATGDAHRDSGCRGHGG